MNSCTDCEYEYGCSLCEECEDDIRFKKKEVHIDNACDVYENLSSTCERGR